MKMSEPAAVSAIQSTDHASETRRRRTRGGRTREWKCSDCDAAFTKREHLLRHERSHTKEKPYACSQCPRTYTRHDSLIRHAKKHELREGGHATAAPENLGHPASGDQPREEQFAAVELGVNDNLDRGLLSLPNELESSAYPDFQNPGGTFTGSEADDMFWLPPGNLDQLFTGFTPLAIPSTSGDFMALFPQEQVHEGSDIRVSESRGGDRAAIRKAVCEGWFTRPTSEASSQQPPFENQSRNGSQVDDDYRSALSSRLVLEPMDTGLPPADFLNLSIKMYFSKFHPVFPILHAASFSPTSENAFLLLSVCSIGALFIGTASAKARGRAIFRKLNKAILASWEVYLYQGNQESLAVAQAVALAQNFGLLTGEPNDLLLTESLHGTIVSWVRQAGIFGLRNTLSVVNLDDTSNLVSTWKSWIRAEEAARIVLALHLHDSQFSAIFHHEPILRHDPEKLPICCSEKIFAAPSATQWHALVISAQRPIAQDSSGLRHLPRTKAPYSSSPINAYASIAGIHASITEAWAMALQEQTVGHLRRSLALWRETWFPNGFETEGVSGWATIQWHHNFMSLYVDFDLLERAIGRDGHSEKAEEDAKTVSVWATSVEGQNCAAHAVLILRRLEHMPLSSEPGLHVPLATFQAGLVVYSHIRWVDGRPSSISFDVPELNTENFKRLSRVLSGGSSSGNIEIDVSFLSRLTDLLQRQGHWEISRKFASILEILIDEISDTSCNEN